MTAKLYVIPGSHPALAARLMLERKGIPYKRRDLIPIVAKGALRLAGFPGVTVPALKINGTKVQGTREIARELDQIQPEPALLPSDPEQLAKVEAAEKWGDEVLQGRPRRLTWWALGKNRSPMAGYSEGAKLGVPIGIAVKTGAPIVALSARFNEATDENVKADLAAIADDLDRVDAFIADGAIGGTEPNAADFQIATSVRLLMTIDDLRPFIASRPAGEMAMRFVPDFPGQTPPVFPEEWLAPLRAA